MIIPPLLKKIVTCFIAGATFAALLLLLGNSGTIPWAPPTVVFSLVALTVFAALLFPFIWQARERRQEVVSVKIYGFLYSAIRYCIAFNLASFGWKKILGLQFVVPIEIAAKPMNEQSGEWLTWFYFGHSTSFGIVIAAIQIIGAGMLLFRKTLLLGLIVLFSFMLNLTLINIFYQMNAGALLQSLVLTLGIFFLLMLHYDRLVHFFINTTSTLPSLAPFKPSLKNAVRLSAILFALLFTLYLKVYLKQ